ncbi:MAG: hypothetical protein ACR2PH_09720, partial [Desulfobulbia bacterium]
MILTYRQYLLALFTLFIAVKSIGQQFEVALVEDTLLTAEVHPTDPTIFHFDTFNNGEETIIIDISKSNPQHPEDWDISICTVACLPPETDEAIFPIGGMLEEEVSIYFYPRSVGQGSVDIHLQSQEDSTETFDIRLYVEAELPTGLEEIAPFADFIRHGDTFHFSVKQNCQFTIHNISGQLMGQKNFMTGQEIWD